MTAEPPAAHSGSAAAPEVAAVTEGEVWAAAGDTRHRKAKTGKNAGTANRVAAAAARGISTIIPGRATAAVTTASMEGTARAGSAMPIGGIATVEAAAAMDADTADTAADMLPAMVAVLGAGVAVAAVAVGIKRSCSM